jgi:hypothetical protein
VVLEGKQYRAGCAGKTAVPKNDRRSSRNNKKIACFVYFFPKPGFNSFPFQEMENTSLLQ